MIRQKWSEMLFATKYRKMELKHKEFILESLIKHASKRFGEQM